MLPNSRGVRQLTVSPEISGNNLNDDCQNQNVKNLVEHHAQPRQIALPIRVHPGINHGRGIGEPVGYKHNCPHRKVKGKRLAFYPGKPEGAEDTSRINGKMGHAGRGKETLFFARGHPVILQQPIADEMAN